MMADKLVENDIKCAILIAGSRMLSYPDTPEWRAGLSELQVGLRDVGVDDGQLVMTALNQLLLQDVLGLAEEYVTRFDLSDATTLHLTAHEHGESRDRGPALLNLAQMFRMTGLLPSGDQLSDYLPQLLEFLAIIEVDDGSRAVLGELESRVAHVCRTLSDRLANESVYGLVFAALVDILIAGEIVPVPVTADSSTRAEVAEEMPYPLHYE